MNADRGAEPIHVERGPSAELASFVTRLWYLRMPSPQRFERIVPQPFVHLIVNLSAPYRVLRRGDVAVDDVFTTAFVSGLQTRFLINENPSLIEHVGVEFQPYGVSPFSMLPGTQLADRVIEGDAVFPGTGQLRSRLLGLAPGRAIDLVEAELRGRLRPAGHPHPVVVSAVRMIAADPDQPIAAIAASSGASHKTLIARFHRSLGVGPKVFADVVRHHRFLSELPVDGPMPTWTDLVARAGYYDQPHFIRVFTRFTGMTPRDYLETRRRFGSEHPSFVGFEDDPSSSG